MDFNKAIVLGRLTSEPEIKTVKDDLKVAQISIATNYISQDKKKVEYHRAVFFGKRAEIAEQYLSKGQLVLVEGRLRTQSWQDRESGKKMYRTEIVGTKLQLGPRPDDKGKSEKKEIPTK